MGFAASTQFDYLYDALAQRYPGIASADGRSANFQFMQTPMAADWGTGRDATAFEIANSTSVSLGGFFIPGDGFAESYRDLVLSLAPAQETANPAYRDCITKIAALDAQRKSIRDEARGEFSVFQADNPGTQATFTQWLQDEFGGADYRDRMAAVEQQRAVIAKTQTDLVKALDVPLALAQNAVSPSWADTMNIDEGGQARAVPLATLGGDLAGDIAKWTVRPQDQYDFDVTVTANDTVTTPWRTTYETQVHGNCWGTSASVSTNTQRIIKDSNYRLRICAVGLNSYKINRGRWYDETLVAPDMRLVEGSAFSANDFFGLNGALHLIPEEIFVMFRPKIQLTTSTQVYRQQIAANADVDISYLDLMGMRFDVGGLASLQPVGNEETTTITLDPPENQKAQIVGIVSKVAWNSAES